MVVGAAVLLPARFRRWSPRQHLSHLRPITEQAGGRNVGRGYVRYSSSVPDVRSLLGNGLADRELHSQLPNSLTPVDVQPYLGILFRTRQPISVCMDQFAELLSLFLGRRAGD